MGYRVSPFPKKLVRYTLLESLWIFIKCLLSPNHYKSLTVINSGWLDAAIKNKLVNNKIHKDIDNFKIHQDDVFFISDYLIETIVKDFDILTRATGPLMDVDPTPHKWDRCYWLRDSIKGMRSRHAVGSIREIMKDEFFTADVARGLILNELLLTELIWSGYIPTDRIRGFKKMLNSLYDANYYKIHDKMTYAELQILLRYAIEKAASDIKLNKLDVPTPPPVRYVKLSLY